MQTQVYIFIIFILNGFLIGILFDIFRILRKSFKTSDTLTIIEDIIFAISSGLLTLFSITKFNNGEVRFYLFLGIVLGIMLYLLTFSRIFIKICINLIFLLKNVIYVIIIKPLNFILKWFKRIFIKPVVFICINFKNKIKKLGKLKDLSTFCRIIYRKKNNVLERNK